MKSSLKPRAIPFVRAHTRFLRDPSIPPVSKAVFLAIKSYGDKNGESCFPAIETIGSDLGLCRDTVCKAIANLKAIGIISILHRKNKSNLYLLNDASWCEISARNSISRRRKKQTPGSLKFPTLPRFNTKASASPQKPNVLPFPKTG